MRFVEKIIATVLLLFALFIVPAVNLANSADDIVETTAYQYTNQFKETICTQGRITQAEYLRFIDSLDTTNRLYDVDIVVGHQTVVPVYGEGNTVVGTKMIDIYTYSSEILEKLYETEGVFLLSKGDSVSITVTSKDLTASQRLRISVMRIPDYESRIIVTAGGVVRDELE